MLSRRTHGEEQDQFSTDGARAFPADMLVSNHFMETHSISHFRHGAFASLFTATGRKSLTDFTYTVRHGQEIETHDISDPLAFRRVLMEEFGLDLGENLDRLHELTRSELQALAPGPV